MALVNQSQTMLHVPMSARQHSRPNVSHLKPPTARSYIGRSDRGLNSGRPGFSKIEVEALIREKLRHNYEGIKNAFKVCDANRKHSISKDEFRRVLSSYCFPMTTNQFESIVSKVEKTPNGFVLYADFLEKFAGGSVRSSQEKTEQVALIRNNNQTQLLKEVNVEILEKLLKEKISENMQSVLKALRLFDYNMDGKIQRYELRKVLENYCFKLTDQQYDKLWQRYDINHTGHVNYKELLQRLGFHSTERLLPTNTVQSALTWPVGLYQSGVNNTDNRIRRQLRQDEQWLKKLTFDQIEQEFRKRMRANYTNLKKSFLSFDKNISGFISLEDLKAILTNFTIPMSNQLFMRLMERCGIKGTGRIAWEIFLEKFQDPIDVFNGQTLPIGRNHKFFPVMEKQSTVLSDDIWNQLYRSIESHYSSFKQAFLEFDINRTGHITRKDFRRILERYTFNLDDNQFKCIMLKLDPNHTNSITYHQFLQIFEEKDKLEGHKWLNSVHRFNEKQKPIIMPWETVEDILREKINENWKNISEALVYHDFLDEGYITPANLKSVIDKYVLPISHDHFQHLLNGCEKRLADGRVSYIEFLERLNVTVSPGDLDGLSSQIYAGNQLSEHQRLTDHINRQLQINERIKERTVFYSAEEVIVRLSDRINQHNIQLHDAFNTYDKTGKGRISKRNFRKLLHNMGFIMKDDQFEELVTKLDFNKGFMTYENFISNFENRNSQYEDIVRTGNHHVNPIRGDEFGSNALEVESKLRTKLRDNFTDLRSAFYKFDDDHNGILTKKNFRRMLDSFMIITSDEEFEKLCQRLGIDKQSKISYQEFLDCFEIRDTQDGHKWLTSVHRYNTAIPPRSLTAEEAHEQLKCKAHRQWADLAKAFLGFDKKKKGVLKKTELRNVLNKFMIPITKEEFNKLWEMYDEDCKGFVSHQDFLVKLGASEFTPLDDGISQQITEASRQNLVNHNLDQHMKHEDATFKQAELGLHMTAEYVEQQLRDKIRDKYKDFYAAFRNYDTKKRGYLSVREIQKVLVDLNFFISDDEFFRLLERMGLQTNQSRLNYDDFLRAFEEGRKSSYGRRKREFTLSTEDYSHLLPQQAEDKLRQNIANQKYTLEKACASFDKYGCGLIALPDFRRILDTFCFKLTNQQWLYFVNKVNRSSDNTISYRAFLKQFSSSVEEDTVQWLDMLQKSSLVTKNQVDLDIPDSDLEDKLKESVAAHFNTVARSLEEIDYAKIGVVSKEDFKHLINTELFKLTDEKFDILWKSLPINEFDNLDYVEFLKEYNGDYRVGEYQSSPVVRSESGQDMVIPITRSHTSMSLKSQSRNESRLSTRSSRCRSRMSTPMVNADSAEQCLKDIVLKHWKDIQKQCRTYDHYNTGTIDALQFKSVLSQYDVNLSSEDYNKIMIKYDLHENGSFCYADFLRHFVLDLKSRDSSISFKRPKLKPAFLEATIEETNNQYFTAIQQLKSAVTEYWKEMRRLFRAVDQQSTGVICTDDFRRILRQFNVNLSEDEFSHMISYFVRNFDDQICYNDFIKAHINHH
ncbi:hypothetical protein SNE40_020073 [Patella caerulea]|uniref:EF-hand domain-containing protein n=1 Tax=Patella caerulea TaxID=87958 RepID=A0AAN8IZ91_PATCE